MLSAFLREAAHGSLCKRRHLPGRKRGRSHTTLHQGDNAMNIKRTHIDTQSTAARVIRKQTRAALLE